MAQPKVTNLTKSSRPLIIDKSSKPDLGVEGFSADADDRANRGQDRRLSRLETALSFAIKEAVAGLGVEDIVDLKRPIVLTPQTGTQTSVAIPLSGRAALRQVAIAVDATDLAVAEGEKMEVSVGEQHYVLTVRDGRAYASLPSLPLGPEALTPRQLAAVARPRPDLPRWADENRSDRGLSLRVSFEVFSAIDQRAKAKGVPRSEILKDALEQYLGRKP